MKELILYIHGKGGSAAECEHYKPLFPDCEVFGLDYQTFTPWETGAEIRTAVEKLKDGYESIILIANSIGAFFCMNAGIDGMLRKAYFISPIVDMEKLIGDMMLWANVSEEELRDKGVIHTDFGEDLSCWRQSAPLPNSTTPSSQSWRTANTGSTQPSRCDFWTTGSENNEV